MNIRFQIPRVLQSECGGKSELSLSGQSVRAVLQQLQRDYPSVYICVCDETGKVRQHINLFINNDLLDKRNGLDTQLKASDVVSVFQAVSGG